MLGLKWEGFHSSWNMSYIPHLLFLAHYVIEMFIYVYYNVKNYNLVKKDHQTMDMFYIRSEIH